MTMVLVMAVMLILGACAVRICMCACVSPGLLMERLSASLCHMCLLCVFSMLPSQGMILLLMLCHVQADGCQTHGAPAID